jgi:hypothetical protein
MRGRAPRLTAAVKLANRPPDPICVDFRPARGAAPALANQQPLRILKALRAKGAT